MTPSDEVQRLVARYRRKGVLVDANLLLLWCVGSIDRRLVTQFKRTRTYVPEDFDLLCRLLGQFERWLTSPNILTEVSNLGDFSGRHRDAFHARFAHALTVLEERYEPSVGLAGTAELRKFGLSDAVSVTLTARECLLLSDDLALVGFVQSRGGDALNFNHIRTLTW